MKKLALILLTVISLAACEERFRYHCQNPDHWAHERCQRPKCQFTQDCPDYLVAPILERKIEAPAPQASSDR